MNEIFNSKNIKAVAFIAIIVVIISLTISVIQTPKYESSAKLLVVINQDNTDPYTLSRSSDYVAEILSEVIYSHSFISNVFKSEFDLRDELGFNREKRLKNWKKMVGIEIKEGRGIITIDVLHEDKDQANQFAQAISYLLITKHDTYHGLGDKVDIKIIDSPRVSDTLAQPKIIRNSVLGLIVGLILGFTFIIIFPEQMLFGTLFSRGKNNHDETIELTNINPALEFDQEPDTDQEDVSQDVANEDELVMPEEIDPPQNYQEDNYQNNEPNW